MTNVPANLFQIQWVMMTKGQPVKVVKVLCISQTGIDFPFPQNFPSSTLVDSKTSIRYRKKRESDHHIKNSSDDDHHEAYL